MSNCTPGSLDPTKKLSQQFQKACHNCYEKKYASTFSSVFNYVEAVEIDFYDTSNAVFNTGEKSNSWYVRHGLTGGNDNNCTKKYGDNGLKDCLADVKKVLDARPNGPLLVIYLDKKEAWGNTRRPVDLDNLITSIFTDTSKIYRPNDLKGTYASAREAAQNNNWPAYSSLNGKVMFVLTGGQTFNHNKTQNTYVQDRGKNAVIFVAPDLDEINDISGTPQQFSAENAKWIVVYNTNEDDRDLTTVVHANSYISRLWGTKEDSATYHEALKRCTNFIAFYDYKFNTGLVDGTFK